MDGKIINTFYKLSGSGKQAKYFIIFYNKYLKKGLH